MDNKALSIEGLISDSSELNKISTDLGDVCTELYRTITLLEGNGVFKSVTASESYFSLIDQHNQMVPKFTEAILRFSKFLSDYVLQNYKDADEETISKIESNLAGSLQKLETLGIDGSNISGAGVDYTKIASTAQGALNGNFIDSKKIHKDSFEGELEFITRDDGSVMITKNGVPVGFTTQEGIGNIPSASNTSLTESSDISATGVAAALGTLGAGSTAASVASQVTEAASVTPPVEDISSTPVVSETPSPQVDPGYTGDVLSISQTPPVENSTSTGQTYTSLGVPPVDSTFKAYMGYTSITNKSSKQYQLQHSENCYTDDSGFRRYSEDGTDYYMIALGSHYTGGEVGKKYRVTLDTGQQFYAITGDQKQDIHTDPTNRYRDTGTTTNVVEFIVDT